MKYIYKPLFAWKRLTISLIQSNRICFFIPTISHLCSKLQAFDMGINFLFWTLDICITK